MTQAPIAVVIEDEPDVSNLISLILRRAGYTVHTADDGASGVAAVQEHRPTLVTVDVGLPDMTGHDVVRQLRGFCSAHVLMLTARASQIDAVLGHDCGADDYLTKPFRPADLRARAQAQLQNVLCEAS